MSNFENTSLQESIVDAAEKHKGQQLNFRFRSEDMLKLLRNLEKTPETEQLIKNAFKEALDKSDKRPMTDQLRLKAKFQKSHGLVFKDIPIDVERSVIFNAILKLGRTMDMATGRLMFPGACKLRSFFFPEVKNRKVQDKRVCFPIFVNKKDQMFIYQWAQNQNGQIQLELENDRTGWNGIVSVELTRDESRDDEESLDKMSALNISSRSSPSSSRIGSRSMSFNENYKRKSSFSSSGFASPVFTPQMSLQSLNAMPFVNGPLNTNFNPLLVQTLLNNSNNMPVNLAASVTTASPVLASSPVLTATTPNVGPTSTQSGEFPPLN